MTETDPPTNGPLDGLALCARKRPTGYPLAGFVPVFLWGLREHVRLRQVLFRLGLSIGLGVLSALLITLTDRHAGEDTHWLLWQVLDDEILGIMVPLTALLLVGPMFSREMRQATMVYHLVRPVSRATLFLARYLAGVVPAAVFGALLFLSTMYFSGVAVGAAAWTGSAATALAGAVVLGAVYYVLGAVFRRGLVVGLVYTFAIEVLLGNLPGTIQKLSVRHYLRSLHHGMTDGAFVERSQDVARAVAATKEGSLLRLPIETTGSALGSLALITAAFLAFGLYRTLTRDFALKD
jgi:ABC-type transport system involved in multi-copper enzyme maturation permease subunit